MDVLTGLKKKQTYHEIVETLDTNKQLNVFPNRAATRFARSAEYLNLLDESFKNIEANQMKEMKHHYLDNILRQSTVKDEIDYHEARTRERSRSSASSVMHDFEMAFDMADDDHLEYVTPERPSRTSPEIVTLLISEEAMRRASGQRDPAHELAISRGGTPMQLDFEEVPEEVPVTESKSSSSKDKPTEQGKRNVWERLPPELRDEREARAQYEKELKSKEKEDIKQAKFESLQQQGTGSSSSSSGVKKIVIKQSQPKAKANTLALRSISMVELDRLMKEKLMKEALQNEKRFLKTIAQQEVAIPETVSNINEMLEYMRLTDEGREFLANLKRTPRKRKLEPFVEEKVEYYEGAPKKGPKPKPTKEDEPEHELKPTKLEFEGEEKPSGASSSAAEASPVKHGTEMRFDLTPSQWHGAGIQFLNDQAYLRGIRSIVIEDKMGTKIDADYVMIALFRKDSLIKSLKYGKEEAPAFRARVKKQLADLIMDYNKKHLKEQQDKKKKEKEKEKDEKTKVKKDNLKSKK